MEVHTKIRDVLSDRDIKHNALAKAIGVKTSSFSNYMTGATTMPYDVFVRVAKYLNVSTDFLLGLTDSREPTPTLSAEEQEIILSLRRLHHTDRAFILQSIQVMLSKA